MGTNLCLAADNEGGFSGTPVVLSDCHSQMTETWKFEEPIALTAQNTSFNYDLSFQIRHVLISVLALAGVGALGLTALFWQTHKKQVCLAGSSMPMGEEQDAGLSMTVPLAISENLNDDKWWNRPQHARARHGNVLMSEPSASPSDDPEEKRLAQDGLSYTKADFIKFYGGTYEWDLAAKAESVNEFWKTWEANNSKTESTEVVDKAKEKEKSVDEFWQRWENLKAANESTEVVDKAKEKEQSVD